MEAQKPKLKEMGPKHRMHCLKAFFTAQQYARCIKITKVPAYLRAKALTCRNLCACSGMQKWTWATKLSIKAPKNKPRPAITGRTRSLRPHSDIRSDIRTSAPLRAPCPKAHMTSISPAQTQEAVQTSHSMTSDE